MNIPIKGKDNSCKIILLYSDDYSASQIQRISLQTFTTSKASVHCAYPKKADLKGLVNKVKVVHGNDPFNFFCQLTEESQNLADLMAKLKAAYAGNNFCFTSILLILIWMIFQNSLQMDQKIQLLIHKLE